MGKKPSLEQGEHDAVRAMLTTKRVIEGLSWEDFTDRAVHC